MSVEVFSILSSDAHTPLSALCYYPDGAVSAALLHCHGMREHKGRYEETAQDLANHGIATILYDAVGHGDSLAPDAELGESPFAPYHTTMVADVFFMFEALIDRFPTVPHFIMGHSLGSFVVRNCLDRLDNQLAGAILMGSGDIPTAFLAIASQNATLSVDFFGKQHRSESPLRLASHLVNLPFAPYATFSDWQSSNPAVVSEFIFDPKCRFTYTDAAFRDFYQMIANADSFYANSRIRRDLPLLFISGHKDIVGAFGWTISMMVNRARRNGFAHVDKRIYANARHEILNETIHNLVLNDLVHWLLHGQLTNT